jgi:L-gulonate 3-dehydrogenase
VKSAAQGQGPGTVALIGSGVIGRGWAVDFLLKGWAVRLYDLDDDASAAAVAEVRAAVVRLAGGDSISPDVVAVAALADAIDGADLVIESVPERIDVKHATLAAIEAAAPADLPIASSTSSLLPSQLAEGMAHPGRFVVAHPFNPSYLIPVVEIVPGDRTVAAVADHVQAVMSGLGKRVVRLDREIEGFVGNRLQAAIVNEAMNLVRLGIASPADIDACVTDCLALRWAFFGPFETMDLNAPQGFGEYAAKFGDSYTQLGRRLGVGEAWPQDKFAMVEESVRQSAPADPEARYARRDAALDALGRVKRELAERGVL